jgi:hypothetical protein
MSNENELVFETELDAPPEKVWRALTVPEYLDRWLQAPADAKVELVKAQDYSLLTYRVSDADDESIVTFELSRQENGNTWFRLTHAPVAANSNEPVHQTLMLAA